MPRELTTDEENQLEKNLVWIFASPRSGTSWLGNQLLTYNTLSMDEPYLGHHIAKMGIIQNRTKFTDYHQKRESYFFCDKFEETWRYYLRKLILNRINAQFENLEKKIVIKEPNGSFGCDQILSCLPNSKFLLLLRDGRDVVDSLLDAKKEGGWATKLDAKPVTEDTRGTFIRNQAKIWKNRTELLFRTFDTYDKELKLKMNYEELRNKTKENLERIYEFIGIKIPHSEIESIVQKYTFENLPQEKTGSGKVTRSASPGKWKEHFSDKEQELMNQIMRQTLKKAGYE
jgi:hypothetical protein